MQSFTAMSAHEESILANAVHIVENHHSFDMRGNRSLFEGLTTSNLANAVTTAGASDQAKSLDEILNSALDAPGSISIAGVPPAPLVTSDVKTSFLLGRTLDSYVSLLTALCVYQEHPEAYNIQNPDEASAFVKAIAKWRNYVLTGGKVDRIAAYLPPGTVIADSINQSSSSATVHMDLLKNLFAAYALSTSAITALDGILTEAVSKLEKLQVGLQNKSQTLDQLVCYYHTKEVDGASGILEARLLTLYINVSPSCWQAAISGKVSAAHYQLDVNYYLLDVALSEPIIQRDLEKIYSAIEALTGNSKSDLDKKLNMKAITVDPLKA